MNGRKNVGRDANGTERNKNASLTGPFANHGLDGKRVPLLHDAVRLVVPVVQDVGVGVEQLPDAVPAWSRTGAGRQGRGEKREA